MQLVWVAAGSDEGDSLLDRLRWNKLHTMEFGICASEVTYSAWLDCMRRGSDELVAQNSSMYNFSLQLRSADRTQRGADLMINNKELEL
jgi:hypothetical protein